MSKVITIDINQQLIDFCKDQSLNITALRGALSSSKTGTPVTWFTLDTNKLRPGYPEQIQYEQAFNVYNSIEPKIIPGGEITASKNLNAKLGDKFVIEKVAGAIDFNKDAQPSSVPMAIQITNLVTGGPEQAGLSSQDNRPIAAFKSYPHVSIFLEPIDQVTLVFAPKKYVNGTAIMSAKVPGVTIDLTQHQQVDVTYDIDNGAWVSTNPSTTPAQILQSIPAESDLQPYVLPQYSQGKLQQLIQDGFEI